jgi:hypothetical protein
VSGRAKAIPGGKWPTLSAEDRAFLDFVARLAVEQALLPTNGDPSAATCGAVQTEGKSEDDGNT